MSVKNNALSASTIYKGTWNATTNTPTIVSGVGLIGEFYVVSVAGNTTIDGVSNWEVDDQIIFSTNGWEKINGAQGQVRSVSLNNGTAQTGDVSLTQANADWNASSGVSQILNRPILANVATSGSYTDLSNKPAIPAAQQQSNWNETNATSVQFIQNKPPIPAPYQLPISSSDTLGGIKIGSGIDRAIDGTASVTKVTSFNNRTGVVQLTGNDIATALGYTPGTVQNITGNIVSGSGTASITVNQVQPDYNATSGLGQILNKPSIPSGAITLTTSGEGPATIDGSPANGYSLNIPYEPPTGVARGVFSIDLSGAAGSTTGSAESWNFTFSNAFLPSVWGSSESVNTNVIGVYPLTTLQLVNNKLFALGFSQNNIAISSDDGANWTAPTTPAQFDQITFDGTRYVFSSNSASIQIFYSTNLTTFQAVNLPARSVVRSITFGAGKVVAIIQDTTTNVGSIIYATDLTVANPFTTVQLPNNYLGNSIAFLNGTGTFVVDAKYYSTDGINWTATTDGPLLTQSIGKIKTGVIGANGLSYFIAPRSGIIIDSQVGIFLSTDGITWTYRSAKNNITGPTIYDIGIANGSLVINYTSGNASSTQATLVETRDLVNFYDRASQSSNLIIGTSSANTFVAMNRASVSTIYKISQSTFTVRLPAQQNSGGTQIYPQQNLVFIPNPDSNVSQHITALRTSIAALRNTYSFSNTSLVLTVNTNATNVTGNSISLVTNSGLINGTLTISVVSGTSVVTNDSITITDPYDGSSFSYNVPADATLSDIANSIVVNENLPNYWISSAAGSITTQRLLLERIVPGYAQTPIISFVKTPTSTLNGVVGTINNGITNETIQTGYSGTILSSFNGRIGNATLTAPDIVAALSYTPIQSVTGNIVSGDTNAVVNQVQSSWTATSGLGEILNKPTIPAAQIQSDWNETDNTQLDFIKNKPTITTYVLPIANSTTLGGIKTGTPIAGGFVSGFDAQGNATYSTPAGGGTVTSVTGNIVNNTNPAAPVITQVQSDYNATSGLGVILNKPTPYSLPVPTTNVIGGVKANTGQAGQFVSGVSLVDGSLQYGTPTGVVQSVTGNIVSGTTANPVITQVNADWRATSGAAFIIGKPTIPPPQVQSDWNANPAFTLAGIANKPILANVAISGSYTDLSNKPNQYVLPAAQANTLGGIQTGNSSTGQFVTGFDANGVAQYGNVTSGGGGTRGVVAIDLSGQAAQATGDEVINFAFSSNFATVLLGNTWSVTNQITGNFRAFINTGTQILAGSNGSGIYKSADGGNSWSVTNQTTGFFYAFINTGTQILAASFGSGIYKSLDGGNSWSQTSQTAGNFQSLINTGTQILAGTNILGIYKSVDGGNNWLRTSQISGDFRSFINTGTQLLAASFGSGIYKSVDGGNSWSQTSQTTGNFLSFINTGTQILAGNGSSLGIYKSVDGGNNWSLTNQNSGIFPSFINTGTQILAGSGGLGIYKSVDGGNSWSQTSQTTGSFNSLINTGTQILAASNAGIYKSTDKSEFSVTLPAHSTYTQVTFTYSPYELSLSQAISSLQSLISAARPTYTFTTTGTTLSVDTNSSANIGDITFVRNGVIVGTLTLSITQGGATNLLPVITITDPRNASTYQFSPASESTNSQICNEIAFGETLSNYWFSVSASNSTKTRLLLESTNTGAITAANQPTISISNPNTLAASVSIVVAGS